MINLIDTVTQNCPDSLEKKTPKNDVFVTWYCLTQRHARYSQNKSQNVGMLFLNHASKRHLIFTPASTVCYLIIMLMCKHVCGDRQYPDFSRTVCLPTPLPALATFYAFVATRGEANHQSKTEPIDESRQWLPRAIHLKRVKLQLLVLLQRLWNLINSDLSSRREQTLKLINNSQCLIGSNRI